MQYQKKKKIGTFTLWKELDLGLPDLLHPVTRTSDVIFCRASRIAVELSSSLAEQSQFEPLCQTFLLHRPPKLRHRLGLIERATTAVLSGSGNLFLLWLPNTLKVLVAETLDGTHPRSEIARVWALAVHEARTAAVANENKRHVEVSGFFLDAVELLAAGDVVGADERHKGALGRPK